MCLGLHLTYHTPNALQCATAYVDHVCVCVNRVGWRYMAGSSKPLSSSASGPPPTFWRFASKGRLTDHPRLDEAGESIWVVGWVKTPLESVMLEQAASQHRPALMATPFGSNKCRASCVRPVCEGSCHLQSWVRLASSIISGDTSSSHSPLSPSGPSLVLTGSSVTVQNTAI